MIGNYKVLGFMTIHYGKDYLEASLTSVRNHVDKMVVAYSQKPSHGFGTDQPCPDTRDEIFEICNRILGDKLIWDEVEQHGHEAIHRNVRYKYDQGFDVILTVDADEVLEENDIPGAIQFAMANKERYYGIAGYLNFFRSFSWVCHDSFRPIRIENLRVNNQLQNLGCNLKIYHFSTAQPEAIMRYKYKIFGHHDEIKKDWLDEIFYKWSPENNMPDLHPVSLNLWNATFFDKTTLPEVLKAHPYYNIDLIR